MKWKFSQIAKIMSPIISSGIILKGVPKLYNFIKTQNITQTHIIAIATMFIALLICITIVTTTIIKSKKEIAITRSSNEFQLQTAKNHEENKTKRTELTTGKSQRNLNPNPPSTPLSPSSNVVGNTNTSAKAENKIEPDEQNSSAQQRYTKIIPFTPLKSYNKGATNN